MRYDFPLFMIKIKTIVSKIFLFATENTEKDEREKVKENLSASLCPLWQKEKRQQNYRS